MVSYKQLAPDIKGNLTIEIRLLNYLVVMVIAHSNSCQQHMHY